jgi:hypothetical protein
MSCMKFYKNCKTFIQKKVFFLNPLLKKFFRKDVKVYGVNVDLAQLNQG